MSTAENSKFEALVRALSKPNTVLFVGSGVSRRSGLPSWSELLLKIADYADSLDLDSAESREFISAAQYEIAGAYLLMLLAEAGKSLDDYLRQDEQFQSAMPDAIHTKVQSFGLTSFITSNFDTLIEQSFAASRKSTELKMILNHDLSGLDYLAGQNSKDFIYKYHGDMNSKGSAVLGLFDYDEIIHERPEVLQALERVLTTRDIVMMGVGLNDKDLDYLLKSIERKYKSELNNIYIITPRISPAARMLVDRRFRLNIIEYDKRDASHSGLLDLLDQIYAKVSDLAISNSAKQTVIAFQDHSQERAVLIHEWDDLLEVDAHVKDVLLSVLHWIGPSTVEQLMIGISSIDDSIDRDVVVGNIQIFLANGIISQKFGRIYAEAVELIEVKALDRIQDAEILLGGSNE